ncbi:porin [Lichenihabitans psoromatis]|uniref:porin n=1 Tax=Lichenihabitans psoromatis TaxID=2528642 RepID=UPI0013F16199|nr:porin [Lichenihabitans psoromatis]
MGAQAADLPFRKAAPVEYVRVCDAFGAGFFYVPGTDTCIRISGQMRAEETFRPGAPTNNPNAYSYSLAGNVYKRDLTSFRARGYLNADSRTQTAYGTLRAFVSFRITNDSTASGTTGGGKAVGLGTPAPSTGAFQGNSPVVGSAPTLDKGFIQFAGFTAGRAQSFFDFDAQSVELLTNSVANSNQPTELFAYTATFGQGFSATIAAEDRNERNTGDSGFQQNGGLVNGVLTATTQQPNATRAGYLAYSGETIPDFVGNLRYDGSWGSAQLSGAYHQVSSLPVTLAARTVAGPAGTVIQPGDADGFAVLGGVKVLLPMISKGDSFTVQGTYERGAMDYANANNYFNGLSNIYSNNTSVGVPVNDAFVRPDGTIALSTAYGAYGNFRHYWIPEVSSSIYGAYLKIENPKSAQRLGAGADNARIFQVGFNTIWTPVKDFQIGAEVLYSNMQLTGLTTLLDNPATTVSPRNPDDYRVRASVRRAF